MARKEMILEDIIRYESGSTNVVCVACITTDENNYRGIIDRKESEVQLGSKGVVKGTLTSLFHGININIHIPEKVLQKYMTKYTNGDLG